MKRTRGIFAVVLLVVLVAGCGGSSDGDDQQGAGDSPTEGGEGMSFALITPGSVQDANYNAIAYEALEHLESMGLETTHSEEVAVADSARVAREYVNAGYDFVAFHGGQFLTVALELAEEFPDANFITETAGVIDDLPENVWNVARYHAPGFYLEGALAAMVTESGTIGYLGGLDIPDFIAAANSAYAGAKSVNEDIDFEYTFNGDQEDAVKGRQAAQALINQGADVLVLSLNNGIYGVAEAVKAAGGPVYITSMFTDQYSVAPDNFMVSILWDFDAIFEDIVERVRDGERSGNLEVDGPSGYLSLSEVRHVDDETLAAVRDIWDQITAGEIEIPQVTDEVRVSE